MDSRIIIIVLAALALVGAAILWWWLPKQQTDGMALKIYDAKARADVEDNFRKTVGQALGGVAVLLGACLAYLQFTQQQQASDRQFTRQQQASHDLLISNQVSKGFEQLGSDKIVVRLGGIYALEGVMNGSDQYHQPVLEALSAFVREGTKPPGASRDIGPPSTDIQAALTVVARRSTGAGTVNLTKANLAAGDLSHADLRGADLSGAVLNNANLTFAKLNHANLHDANLIYAKLSDANLTGTDLVTVNLSGADLSRTDLSHADLRGADLSGAVLNNATLNAADFSFINIPGVLTSGFIGAGGVVSYPAKVEQKQLDTSCGSGAKLPPGLTLKPCP